jgi:hypothetical protein
MLGREGPQHDPLPGTGGDLMTDFYIHIKQFSTDRYTVSHDGIEACGLTVSRVMQKVVHDLGIQDTLIGRYVDLAVAEEAHAESNRIMLHAESTHVSRIEALRAAREAVKNG